MNSRRRLLQALAASLLPAELAASPPEITDAPLRWLALGDIGGLAVIDAEATGTDGRTSGAWLLDTGAEAAVVNAPLALQLGLRRHGTRDVRSPGGRVAGVPMVDAPGLCTATGCLALPEAVALDLSAHDSAAGEPMQGIVGWSTLGTRPWQLDISAGRLRAGDAAAPPPSAQALECSATHALPVLEGRLGDARPARLLLDTGFAGALMLWSDAAAALARRAGPSVSVEVDGIGGRSAMTAVLLSRLRIGDATWTDVPVLLLPASPQGSTPALDGVTGAVGMALFETGAVGGDPARRTAWTTAASAAPLAGGFGLVLATSAGRLLVQQVMAGSPAEAAGVRPGDELISVDAEPPVRPSAPAVWAGLRGHTQAVFEWRRGDARRSTSLARERFFARVG